MERPAPPVTVSIPGRGPAELLSVGPAPSRPDPLAPRARRERWTGLAGAAVLAGGVLAVTTDGSPVPLLSVSARGFVVTVVGGGLPQPVPVDRIGTSLLLDLDVRVVDCSVDSQAPRAVTVEVRRGTFGPTAVRASSGAQVVRALDRLVSRTCRRPRG